MTRESASEAFARLYDLDLATDDPGDAGLYLDIARRTRGPVLELAVGSGRLAVRLAEAGHRVTGVDLDEAMLHRARERADAAGVTRRVRLVHADLVDIRLPDAGSYRLAFLALNSLFLLATRRAQAAAFDTLSTHLAPGGLAVVDVWLPHPADVERYDGRWLIDDVREDPATGRLVTKSWAASHDAASRSVTLTTVYDEGRQGEPPVRWVRRDAMRLVTVDELVGFAGAAGLEVETLGGDYDLAPIGPGSERAVLVAVRP